MTTTRQLLTDQMRRRLVARRKHCRCSQKELAARMGCTNVFLCNMECGRMRPSYEMLVVWCEVLGLKLKVSIE